MKRMTKLIKLMGSLALTAVILAALISCPDSLPPNKVLEPKDNDAIMSSLLIAGKEVNFSDPSEKLSSASPAELTISSKDALNASIVIELSSDTASVVYGLMSPGDDTPVWKSSGPLTLYDGDILAIKVSAADGTNLYYTVKIIGPMDPVITFVTGEDATTIDSVTIRLGSLVHEPDPPPSRPGYYFVGWYTSSQFTQLFMFDSAPTSNTEIHARWAQTSKLPVIIVMAYDNKTGKPITPNDIHSRYQNNPHDAYVTATVGYGDRENGIEYFPAQIRARGHGSIHPQYGTRTDKRNYHIRFDKRQEVFGMPANRHWTTIAGVHNTRDNSMLKHPSALAYGRFLSERDGYLEFALRTLPAIDLYMNGEYWGVHNFSEHLRIDPERVNLEQRHGFNAAEYANSAYLMNCELWDGHFDNQYPWAVFRVGNNNNYYVLKAPDGDDAFSVLNPNVNVMVDGQRVTSESYEKQRDWIQEKTSELWKVLNGNDYNAVTQLVDIPSFVDSYIVHELWRNSDQKGGYHIYKKNDLPGNPGKFYAGPPWDFKASVENSYNGSLISSTNGGYHSFFVRLRSFPAFRTAVKTRWQEVSSETKAFITDYFERYTTDSEYIAAMQRNNKRWTSTSEWGNRNWLSDANTTKTWLLNRAGWLDSQFNSW